MPDLEFQVTGVEVVPYAAAPLLAFQLAVRNTDPDQAIHSVVLRCQVRIEVTRRRYDRDEEERLRDLFGEPERWGRTLRAMLWTHASAVLQPFVGETVTELHVPCSYDFNLGATKYFYGLARGEVPLSFLFSGSIFYQDDSAALQVWPVSWTKEAQFRLPVSTWQRLMDAYYPNLAFLQLRRDVYDRLYQYKVKHGIPTWEQALEAMLRAADEGAPV
jgi:uncharacterized protein DUF6084